MFRLLGSTLFFLTEKNWSYFEALYFCFIAFRTIGYGDFVPTSPFGQAIFVFYVFVGVGTVTYLVSVVTEDCSKRLKQHVINVEHRRKAGALPTDDAFLLRNLEPKQFTPDQVKELIQMAKKLERNMQRILKRGNNQMNNGGIRRRASFSARDNIELSQNISQSEWALMSSYHEKFNRIIVVIQNHLIHEGLATT
ncbi:Potassium channel [Basidiobolus ranarum]|uniref:Potassium channel n=1 Tax=Basidiobolus ranarum TaxID=34480 RepID=A0ABR2WDF7_9FUNG